MASNKTFRLFFISFLFASKNVDAAKNCRQREQSRVKGSMTPFNVAICVVFSIQNPVLLLSLEVLFDHLQGIKYLGIH